MRPNFEREVNLEHRHDSLILFAVPVMWKAG
jgi:hypothetical protein